MKIKNLFNIAPERRAGFLVVGSAMAAFGFLFPDLYEVTYASSAPTKIPATQLHGIVGDFNGLSGPYRGWDVLIGIIYLGLIGLLARYLGLEGAKEQLDHAKRILRIFSISTGTTAALSAILLFFWQFNGNALPKATTKAFIARQGGGAKAVAESHYLFASLGGISVFLVIGGLLIALAGFYPKIRGVMALVAGVGVLLLCAGLSIGLPIPGVTESQTIPAADGSRPHTSDSCVLSPGGDENCESVAKQVTLTLPNHQPNIKGCAYTITVTWGDHSAKQSAVVHASTNSTLYTVRHTYADQGTAYALVVTEKVTAGSCKADPALWKPQFATAVRIH